MDYIDDNGQVVTVTLGICGENYIACRINPRTGGGHRVKSKDLPPVRDRGEAVFALAKYAEKRKWKIADTPPFKNESLLKEDEMSEENKEIEKTPARMDLERALKPFADNLEYNRDRVIEETIFILKGEVVAKYEIGKRLILLKERESVETFRHILETYFPGLERSYAYRYMLFTRKVSQLPNLKSFAEGNGNFAKCLALLEFHDDEELALLEAGEPVAGVKLDEIDKMSFRDLKKTLRGVTENHRKERVYLEGDVSQLRIEVEDLKEENKGLRSETQTPEIYAKKYAKVDKLLTEAVRTLGEIPPDALINDPELNVKVNISVFALERITAALSEKINEAALAQ